MVKRKRRLFLPITIIGNRGFGQSSIVERLLCPKLYSEEKGKVSKVGEEWCFRLIL
jgi:hypothetical protein